MPVTAFKTPEKYVYQNGFQSYHETEAIPGALPVGANSPQKPPYGLYAEKLSGTAFTALRHENLQTWLYRNIPAAAHSHFVLYSFESLGLSPDQFSVQLQQVPNQLRCDPFEYDESVNWVNSLKLVAGAGTPAMKTGLGIFIYAVGRDMKEKHAFYSADGDFLIVPQHGVLDIQTELGHILARPNEIVVYPFIQMKVIVELVPAVYKHLQGDANGVICGANNLTPQPFDDKDIQIIKIMVATALVLEQGRNDKLGQQLIDTAESAFRWRARDVQVDLKGLQILTLMRIYYFHCDDEVLAWRTIGFAARVALELGLHRMGSLEDGFPDSNVRHWASRLFWCIYVLDKRWSFGTGMQFALQDSDIDPDIPTLRYDGVPYLHCLVEYGRICSKVWSTVAGFSAARAHKNTISYLDFQIQHWLQSIPAELQLLHPRTGTEANNQSRSLQKLRVLLYIRGNQMRSFVHRHNILSATNISRNPAGARLVTEIAKDTINVLVHLRESSKIYDSDQGTFNYFLVSAISAIFLAVCHAPAEFSHSCRQEFYSALGLLRQFSRGSRSSRRLWKSVQGLKSIAPKLGLVLSMSSLAAPSGPEQQHTAAAVEKSASDRPARQTLASLILGEASVTTRATLPVPASSPGREGESQNSASYGIENLGSDSSTSGGPTSPPDDMLDINSHFTNLFDALGDVYGQGADAEYSTQYEQFLLDNNDGFSRLFENLL